MRWERGQDPVGPTWTTLDNAVVDDDLSCRALGLLTRWLRRPPGVEIDGIPEMVKRARRSGKTRLEGRDALYAASYELERAGYLVRELVSAPGGRHEWVVRVYAQPVPVERRSDPEDRRTGRRGRSRASSQVAPITGFQESENQESVFPDSAKPDSEDQDSSSKNSVNDSLSGGGAADGAGRDGERETAAPPTDQGPTGDGSSSSAAGSPTGATGAPQSAEQPTPGPIPAQGADSPSRAPQSAFSGGARGQRDQDQGAGQNSDQRFTGRASDADRVVAEWMTTLATTSGVPTPQAADAVRRDVARLLANGETVEHLTAAAIDMARTNPGYRRLSTHLEHYTPARPTVSRAALIAACPNCDDHGQYETTDGLVGNCRHRGVDRERVAALATA